MKIFGLEYKKIDFNERYIESNKIVYKIFVKYSLIFFSLYYLLLLFYDAKGSYIEYTKLNLLYFFGFYVILKLAATLFHFRYCEASKNIDNNKTICFIMAIIDLLLLGSLSFINDLSLLDVFANFGLFVLANDLVITYIAPKYNFKSVFIYIFISEIVFFLLPIYPDIPSYTNGILLLLLPLCIMIGLTSEKEIIEKYGSAKDFGHLILYLFIYVWIIFSLLSSNITKYKLSIMSNNSMENAISEGDLLIVRDINKIDINDLKVDDVVQFNYKGHILTHRIVKKNDAEVLTFTTMGDNNSGYDYPDTEVNQLVSKVEYVVPHLGDLVDKLFGVN